MNSRLLRLAGSRAMFLIVGISIEAGADDGGVTFTNQCATNASANLLMTVTYPTGPVAWTSATVNIAIKNLGTNTYVVLDWGSRRFEGTRVWLTYSNGAPVAPLNYPYTPLITPLSESWLEYDRYGAQYFLTPGRETAIVHRLSEYYMQPTTSMCRVIAVFDSNIASCTNFVPEVHAFDHWAYLLGSTTPYVSTNGPPNYHVELRGASIMVDMAIP